MPKGIIRGPADESRWKKAKEIIHKQYPKLKEGDTEFWKRAMAIYKNMKHTTASEETLEGWLYLIHHVVVDEKTGKEELHHCPMLDHIGNKYKVDHFIGKNGEIIHGMVDLMEDQMVYYSDEEAIADGHTVPCADRQLES